MPKMFGSEPNVSVHPDPEPEPPFRFEFEDLVEPNPEQKFRFVFEHCLECSEPDHGQSILRWMDCLSIIGKLGTAMHSLDLLKIWANVSNINC